MNLYNELINWDLTHKNISGTYRPWSALARAKIENGNPIGDTLSQNLFSIDQNRKIMKAQVDQVGKSLKLGHS